MRAKAMSAIASAVGAADLTPSEASELAALLIGFVKTLEAQEVERRLAALEKSASEKENTR